MEKEEPDTIEYADDTKQKVGLLVTNRLPWLIVGLVGGLLFSLIVSRFEAILDRHISLVFFLPLVIYLSDAVGTQTQTIFVRNLARPGKDNFLMYVFKEFTLGIVIGSVLGLLVGVASYIWLKDPLISVTVAVAILVNVTVAPFVALVVSEILYKRHSDPALGSGPVTTVIQDAISIFLYFLIAYLVLLH